MTEFGDKSLASYPNVGKKIKDKLPTECRSFEAVKFNGFVTLFDLIQSIKAGN